MKKIISSISAFTIMSSLIVSCGDSAEKKTSENKPEKDTLTVEQKAKPEEKPVVSLTNKEVEARMKAFLKENRRKYSDYGQVDDIKIAGGNYNSDGALDYFFNVAFNYGGEFLDVCHFFYNSEDDKIIELVLNKGNTTVKYIHSAKISNGKINGEAIFWGGGAMGIFADRSVDAEFMIEGNKINFDKKYIPKFKKAEREIAQELEQSERQLMENADGVNSSEDADY